MKVTINYLIKCAILSAFIHCYKNATKIYLGDETEITKCFRTTNEVTNKIY